MTDEQSRPDLPGRHEATELPSEPLRLGAELRDAISVRTVVLVCGVLLLQLGFILSYIGAFHAPSPHRIELDVAAPAQVVGQLNAIPGEPLHAVPVADETAARARIRSGHAPAALIVNPQGSKDTLLVASAAGTATATAVESVVAAAEHSQRRTITTTDIVTLQPATAVGSPVSTS
jgi:hypothetical protein